MSVTATVRLDVMDLSGVFCGADSGVLQDSFLWNSMGMHTCSVWLSNNVDQAVDIFGPDCSHLKGTSTRPHPPCVRTQMWRKSLVPYELK